MYTDGACSGNPGPGGWGTVLIFGDYINDLDMLVRTPNSYAVANAHPDVKKVCAHVLPHTNEEQGVVRALVDIFGMEGIPL